MAKPFLLYTDHRNLISMYSPIKCTKQSAERLIRWGLELRDYTYIIRYNLIIGLIYCLDGEAAIMI